MASGDVSKPYISAVQRSIELNFRSLSHASLRLSRALAVSERVMHRRLWKLRGQRQLLQPHDWQTRSELQTHLGALAVVQRQQGGGRVFSKDKHEFYEHDAHDAAQQQHWSRPRQPDPEAEAGAADPTAAAAAGAVGVAAEERRSGSGAAARQLGGEEKQAHTAREQQGGWHGSEAECGGSAQPQLVSLCGDSADFSGYLSSQLRLRRQRAQRLHSRPATAARAASAPPAQQQRGEGQEPPLSLSSASRPPGSLPHPATSPFPLPSCSRPLSLDQQASELMSSIHSRHAQAQRELVYAGGGALSRQQAAAAAEAQNLFAGVKDRWHSTFTELREIEQEEEEEQQERRRAKARQQQRAAAAEGRKGRHRQTGRQSGLKPAAPASVSARRPSTSPVTHVTHRPTLPTASGLRPATAGGAVSLLSHASAAPAHSSLPASFPLPLSLRTFTQLAPIVRLPGHGGSDSAPGTPVAAQPSTAAVRADSPALASAFSEPAVRAAAAVSSSSVFAQQRDAVLRANFLRFLSTTEPQIWEAED